MDPTLWLIRMQTLLRDRLAARNDRGDVPGWVLVTVMTITVGMGLFQIAKPELSQMLRSALNSVR